MQANPAVTKHDSAGPGVGLLFDLRNPDRWRTDPARLHSFTLELCEEAERLGAQSLWFTEHHLFDDGYLTQPLTFAAAAAARTSRVRIGTAVVVAPLHHPVELAEQAALVDLLSGGRLTLGLGAGYRIPEYELYGVSPARRFDSTDAIYRELHRLWRTGDLTPAPIQQPPPVYLGYMGPKGARRAGLLGAGLLTADAGLWPIYRSALLEAGHDESHATMAGGVQAWVAEDPDRDWPRVSEHFAYQVNSYRRHGAQGTGRPPPPPIMLGEKAPTTQDCTDATPLQERLADFWFGTPETVADRINDHTAGAPVDTVFLWASIGGMPEELAREHVTTICTRLAPLLKSHDQQSPVAVGG